MKNNEALDLNVNIFYKNEVFR
ncbi:hypothetical protein IMPR6_90170 [Imperialibacter sp. EC-SDR9]|nr:hypothetical protein IMPERIA89_740085 [Imperialibacter sp. 89]VVT35701.1 hypothetical protein IMPR6_90170 [Imperialibacter sp. EC-SDR9]